jgi:hypothetical protein
VGQQAWVAVLWGATAITVQKMDVQEAHPVQEVLGPEYEILHLTIERVVGVAMVKSSSTSTRFALT